MTDLQAREPSAPVLSVEAGVATLTLNRPAHRNRLEAGDLLSLLNQFEQINADPGIRVLKLTANTQGQPRPVFCAGYHLGSFNEQDNDPQLFDQVPTQLRRWIRDNGKIVKGLINRREKEISLWNTPI